MPQKSTAHLCNTSFEHNGPYLARVLGAQKHGAHIAIAWRAKLSISLACVFFRTNPAFTSFAADGLKPWLSPSRHEPFQRHAWCFLKVWFAESLEAPGKRDTSSFIKEQKYGILFENKHIQNQHKWDSFMCFKASREFNCKSVDVLHVVLRLGGELYISLGRKDFVFITLHASNKSFCIVWIV